MGVTKQVILPIKIFYPLFFTPLENWLSQWIIRKRMPVQMLIVMVMLACFVTGKSPVMSVNLNDDEAGGHVSDTSIMPLLTSGDASTVQTECSTFVDVVCDVRIFTFSRAI